MTNFLAINYKTKVVTWSIELSPNQLIEELIESFKHKGFNFKNHEENSNYAHFTKNASDFEIKATELYLIYTMLNFNLEYRPKIVLQLEDILKDFNKIRNKTFSYYRVLSQKNILIDVLERIDALLKLKIEQVLHKSPLSLNIEGFENDKQLNLEYILFYYEAINNFFSNLTVTTLSELKGSDLNLKLKEDSAQAVYNRQHSSNLRQHLFSNIKYDTHNSVSLSLGLR